MNNKLPECHLNTKGIIHVYCKFQAFHSVLWNMGYAIINLIPRCPSGDWFVALQYYTANFFRLNQIWTLSLSESAKYCIAGNIGESFNLANWRFWKKLPNLNPFNPFVTTVDTIKWRIAKLKLAKCCLWSKSPNFLLTNIFRYTVFHQFGQSCDTDLNLYTK